MSSRAERKAACGRTVLVDVDQALCSPLGPGRHRGLARARPLLALAQGGGLDRLNLQWLVLFALVGLGIGWALISGQVHAWGGRIAMMLRASWSNFAFDRQTPGLLPRLWRSLLNFVIVNLLPFH